MEAEYRASKVEQAIRYHRIGAPLGALVYLSYAAWDRLLNPEASALVFEMRCLGLLLIGLFYLATYTHFFRRHEQLVTGSLALVFGVILVWSLQIMGLLASGIVNIALVLMIFSALFRLRSTAALISSLGIAAFTHQLMRRSSLPASSLAISDIQLVGGLMVAVAFARLNESYDRRNFELEVQLRREQERTAHLADEARAANEARIRWLERLAGFLRHELKNHLVGVRTSIELARRTSADQKDEPHLRRATRSTDVMLRLLAAATEATSLEAALRTDAFSRVDLGALVVERCADFEPVADGRELRVSANGTVAVLGDPARLVQLLDKLLGNACDHGAAGSPIRVRVAVEDSRAVLEVQNEGGLPTDRNQLFEPFHSQVVGASSENLGIGLYVARIVAESHGGTISAGEPAPGEVVIRVELPLT